MTPTVEITNKLYETLKKIAVPFEDKSPEDVIWRLIRERETRSQSPTAVDVTPTASDTGGLVSAGVLIPNGLQLRFTYRGRQVPADVRDGRIWIGDRAFTSPSAAAVAAAESLGSQGSALNGWWYWEYNDEGTWRQLDWLRKDGQKRQRAARR